MSLDAQRSWMYSGWKDNGRHSDEWIRNTNAFVNHVFEGVRSFKFGVSCPCSKCCNGSRRTKQLMTSHLCHWGFMPNYFRWIALVFCIYYLLCRHWKDIPVVRKGRRPASVLTCLLKSNHPGILDYDGVKVIATEWEHNHAVKDTNGHSVAEKIEDVFWLRYKYEDAYLEKAKQHVRRCCKSLLPSIFYYARIQAIIDHFRKTENTSMNDKLAGQYYLDRAQYLAQRQGWLGKEAWIVVVDEWCSEEKSKKYRANHFSSKFKPHKGGSNSMTTISQKMSEETGEEVNQIQAWVHTHRGVDKSTPLILNTPEATKCLVISEVRATGTSSAALKRRRAEEIEDVRRKESEKTKKAEAYADNLLSWGVGMYEHCNGIHKFLQTLATNQGVPIGEIPPPPVPPPSHSLSPPGSPQ